MRKRHISQEIPDESRPGTGEIIFNFWRLNRIIDFPTSQWLSVELTGTFDRSPDVMQCQEKMVGAERS